MECLRLRVEAIAFTRNEVVVRRGKSNPSALSSSNESQHDPGCGRRGIQSPADHLFAAVGKGS